MQLNNISLITVYQPFEELGKYVSRLIIDKVSFNFRGHIETVYTKEGVLRKVTYFSFLFKFYVSFYCL